MTGMMQQLSAIAAAASEEERNAQYDVLAGMLEQAGEQAGGTSGGALQGAGLQGVGLQGARPAARAADGASEAASSGAPARVAPPPTSTAEAAGGRT